MTASAQAAIAKAQALEEEAREHKKEAEYHRRQAKRKRIELAEFIKQCKTSGIVLHIDSSPTSQGDASGDRDEEST